MLSLIGPKPYTLLNVLEQLTQNFAHLEHMYFGFGAATFLYPLFTLVNKKIPEM